MKLFPWICNNRKTTGVVLLVFALSLAAVFLSRAPSESDRVKNVILVIGDGMGPQEIGLLMAYAHQTPDLRSSQRKLHIERFMNEGDMGLMRTSSYGVLVTDSAAAGTQMATGRYSRSGMLGLDYQGNPVETILEKARRAGKLTALISDTRITHATPASFASHVPLRSMENRIALELAREGADIMLSGGLRHWLPAAVNRKGTAEYNTYRSMIPPHMPLKSNRKDEADPLAIVSRRGYEMVFDRRQLERAKSVKILGLFSNSEMPDGITVNRTRKSRDRHVPTLREMTEKALDILSSHRDGFFLMVEAGLIDWAGHQNDAGRLLHEMLVLDETIGAVMKWASGRNDTLIIVTADHETGGFAFSYSRHKIPQGRPLTGKAFGNRQWEPSWNYGDPGVLEKIYAQRKSFEQILREFDALPAHERTPDSFRRLFNDAVGFPIAHLQAEEILRTVENPSYDPKKRHLADRRIPLIRDFSEFNVAGSENRTNLMARAIARDQGVVWATGTHTSTPVLVIAWGPEKWKKSFRGTYHSTRLGGLMIEVMGL